MQIGVPTEIKTLEHRVGLVPASVREFTRRGHRVLVETGAGAAINFSDGDYREAGAQICDTAAEIFEKAEMIVKVKEPQQSECRMLRPGQVLFTYLHLAADPAQAEDLVRSGCVAIAYETVTDRNGGLPLLAPMSEIAGKLSAQEGAHYLQKHNGGLGRLMGGVPGVRPARVVVLGGGMAGLNAARAACGMGAEVTILEKSLPRMRDLDNIFQGRAVIEFSSVDSIARRVCESDIVIGAVLIPGAAAPKLVSRAMLKNMIPGAVMVDIAIDQGGCFETSRPTTHAQPTYVVDGIVHYCVANMPGAVPLTSSLALNQSVLPFALALADKGWKRAMAEDPHLRAGLNVCGGDITHDAVAEALGMPFNPEPPALAA